MKKSITFLLILSFSIASSQSFNKEIVVDSVSNLIGKFNKESLQKEPYAKWFEKNYSEYKPNDSLISELKNNISQYTISVFMGTWCGDSKREVPRFYKILESVEFPLERVTNIAVSRERDSYKQSIGGEEEGLNIHRVPTFIIYKNGKEINRIVEHPVSSLEEDLFNILSGDYQPNYNGVTVVNELLEKMGIEKFIKREKAILKKVKSDITKFSELNTYSSVLFYAGKIKEGITIAELNTKLYPLEPHSYISLGNKYTYLKNNEKAKLYYEKALSLDPKNKRAKKALANFK